MGVRILESRKRGKVAAKDINIAVANLRKFASAMTCYFCGKPECDGYQSILVKIHMKCSKDQQRKVAKLLGGR